MLTDANGEERKGIYIDMLCEDEQEHLPVWFSATGADCWLIAVGSITLGMSDRERETIRDLMLAGF